MNALSSINETFVTIALAIVGVAVLAVLVSKNATTPSIIQNLGSAFGNGLAVAEAPVTGAKTPINLSYASMGFGGLNMQALNSAIVG